MNKELMEALDMLEKEKGNISPDGEISINESEIGDIFRRAVKGFSFFLNASGYLSIKYSLISPPLATFNAIKS